jgi:hypothetical protein
VRVARQQDFMRDLREQVDPGNIEGQLDKVAKAVGHAIKTTFPASASELLELAKLVAFSQGRPVRQVKFQASNVNAAINGGSYVTSTSHLEQATLEDFLGTHEPSRRTASRATHSSRHRHHRAGKISPRAAGLVPTNSESEVVKAALKVPFQVLYPAYQTAAGRQQTVRAYSLPDEHGHPTTPTWSSGRRPGSAATTTSRAPTG